MHIKCDHLIQLEYSVYDMLDKQSCQISINSWGKEVKQSETSINFPKIEKFHAFYISMNRGTLSENNSDLY